MRACSSGRFEGASSTSTTSAGSRSASAASTWPARIGSPAAGGGRAAAGRAMPGRRLGVAAGHARRQRRADRGRRGQQHELRRAAVRLGRVVGHERDPRAVLARTGPAGTGTAGTPPPPRRGRGRGRRACRAAARRPAGRWPANCGWSWGKPARAPNDSCQTGQASRSASAVSAAQPSGESAPAPTTSAGERASASRPASSATASGSGSRPSSSRAGAAVRALGVRGLEPVVHRHDHERGAAAGARLVPGARDGPGHVLRARRLLDPDRVVAGQPLEPPGQERLLGHVAAVLLPDHAPRAAPGSRARWRARPPRCRGPPWCAGARRRARRCRSRSRSRCPPRSPRAARGRSGCRPAAPRGTTPRSSRGWRRSS